jgi:group I intron endonuclease
MQGIYCIEHIKSGRKYYGSSINVQKRLKQHKKELTKQMHHNIQLQRAFDKYGELAFTFALIEETEFDSQVELLAYEQTYLDHNVGGYNMAPANGGDCLSNHPEKDEIRARIIESHKDTIAAMTDEERKLRWSRGGAENYNWKNGGVCFKLCPQCGAKKISSTANCCGNCRQRVGKNNPFYNQHHTEETKEHLRKINIENSWIRGIDPTLLPYTIQYEVTYPTGAIKQVAGLKAIAQEFDVSIANVHATIKRIASGKIPRRGKLAGVSIRKIA